MTTNSKITEDKSKGLSTQNKPGKKDGSKNSKSWIFLTIAVISLAISGYIFINNQNQSLISADLQDRNKMLQDGIAEQDSLLNEWMNTFNEIEEDLNTMQQKELFLSNRSDDPEFPKDLRKRILGDIQSLNTLLEQNKQKVAELNKKLKNSSIKIAAFEDKINKLENILSLRDSSIQDLKMELVDRDFAMAELNLLVDSLDKEVFQQQEIISNKEQLLNTAFIATGSQKELEKNGIMIKEGGFLGLGKSKKISNALSENSFSKIAINKTNRIDVNARKVELISEHPNDSYEIVSNDGLVAYIDIKKPDKFWKITRYAVVETKN